MKTLETPRLALRNFAAADAEDIYAFLSDEQTCLDDGGYHAVSGKDDPEFIGSVKALAASDEHYAIELKATGRVVGLVHIMPADIAPNAAELGYVIAPAYRRNGYAKEAVRAVIDRLFSENAPAILCTCYEYNAASAKTLETLGFTLIGREAADVEHPQHGRIDSLVYHLYA